MMQTYDAIIVGGGHNGLTCAAYLGKAGKKVLVLEARSMIGGLVATHAALPKAPGFMINRGGSEFIMTQVRPSVVEELGLEQYCFRWVQPPLDPIMSYLTPSGGSIAFWRDIERTKAEIRRFSPKDAFAYQRMADALTAFLDVGMPYMMGHPWRISPKTAMRVAAGLARGRGQVATGARIILSSIDSVLEEWFESDELRTAMATYSLANFGPPSESASGFSMAVIPGFHRWGVRRPVGGSMEFPKALAACIEAHGGEIRTSTRVRTILSDGGRAYGVQLESGEEIRARSVAAAVDPHTLVTKLMAPEDVPETLAGQIRGLRVNRFDLYTFKLDVALDRPPVFPRFADRDRDVLSVVTLCPSLESLRASMQAALTGTWSEDPPLICLMHSVQDRSLVPPGSNGDTLYFYLTSVASQLSGGRDWLTEKHRFAQAILDHFEQYAPGTQDSIIDMLATSPPEFESEFNVYKGSYNHADPILSQMGPTRPVPALRGWRTPVDGLWHTGAGAFPFGWISGWPGRGTAREILRVDKRHRRPAMPPATVEPAPSGPPQSVDVPSASTHAPVA
ncbi:MAG: hypothetical protein QOF68_3083 [Gaiellales bacterium]|jgi:beta-carotene ketolase (CrtO type)|nr:hypothetical protein [Gaiellales bacterium]